jgi:putative drug exporter of the RND superfamily
VRRLASTVAGRRGKWLVIAAWVVLLFVFAPLGSKLADKTRDDTESFLPKNAESTEVVRLLENEFPEGETATGLIVYQREGGLTQADKEKIRRDAFLISSDVPVTKPPAVPFLSGSPPGLVSPNGEVAYTVITVPQDFDKLGDWGKEVKDATGEGAGGLKIYLTGDLGFNTDAEEIFSSIDTKLLLATVLLVLILLGAIYRSPVIALIPLFVVGFAYTVAQGLIYLYAEAGATVSSNTTSIIVVLMFGVGTDYCLLLVSRYREELRTHEDKHDAMQRALSRTGPAILASGLTVSLAMLVLLVAEVRSVQTLGPVAAIGVASVLLAGLTLLPALLTIAGRRGFWPRRSIIAFDPEAVATARPGLWRRFGDRVLERPAPALAVTVLFFGAGTLGLLAFKVDYSTTTFFKKQTDSVDGFRVLEKTFPAGLQAPMTALVERENGPVRQTDLAQARRRLAAVPDVAAVTRTGERSRDGTIGQLSIVLAGDPYDSDALDVVPKLRNSVDDVAPGARVLVGGGSAIQYDFDRANSRDLKIIVPLALAVIAVILAILLNAIVAPLVLIGSVILSFFGTFGLSMLFVRYVVGDAGVDNSLPTFAFIFLVALGVDYTIFLMSRVREEARQYGTREGMLRALSATGPVITSAGIILAGTFSVLMTLPVTFTFVLGFMVALGILLDTFVVRTIMVPAAVELIGDKIWWPSTATSDRVLLHEEAGAEEAPAHPAKEPVP